VLCDLNFLKGGGASCAVGMGCSYLYIGTYSAQVGKKIVEDPHTHRLVTRQQIVAP
jgi:hypothetical protein